MIKILIDKKIKIKNNKKWNLTKKWIKHSIRKFSKRRLMCKCFVGQFCQEAFRRVCQLRNRRSFHRGTRQVRLLWHTMSRDMSWRVSLPSSRWFLRVCSKGLCRDCRWPHLEWRQMQRRKSKQKRWLSCFLVVFCVIWVKNE